MCTKGYIDFFLIFFIIICASIFVIVFISNLEEWENITTKTS